MTFRVLYVFIVLRHDRRHIVHFNVTANPCAEWAAQQIINAFPYPLFVEADYATMPDGRILACSRHEWLHPLADHPMPYPHGVEPASESAGRMVLIESTDEGRLWSEPRDFLGYSKVHGQLTLLKDGRSLCTYSHYHLPFGVAAVVSYDYGKT